MTPEKYSIWTPVGGQHPRDSVRISHLDVHLSPAGGGFVRAMRLDEFLEKFSPAPETSSPLYLEYFGFDDLPWILGFTNGRRWNGWGQPLIEKSCLEAYAKIEPELFGFLPNGDVRYLGDPDGEDEESYLAHPMPLLWKGQELTVYDLGGLGLCWNHAPLDLDDTDDYTADDLLSIGQAIIPEGWDRDALHTQTTT